MIILPYSAICLSGKSLSSSGKTTVPDSVIHLCQIDKYGTSLFLDLGKTLGFLWQRYCDS